MAFLLNFLESKSLLSKILSILYLLYPKCSNANAIGNKP